MACARVGARLPNWVIQTRHYALPSGGHKVLCLVPCAEFQGIPKFIGMRSAPPTGASDAVIDHKVGYSEVLMDQGYTTTAH